MRDRKTTEPSEPSKNIYDDDNIPEIDLPKTTDATNVIPEELPQKAVSR